MVGHCLTWIGEGEAGIGGGAQGCRAVEPHRPAQIEVMALESIGFALAVRGDFDEAEPWIEQATGRCTPSIGPPLSGDEPLAPGDVPARAGPAWPKRASWSPRPSSSRSRSASDFSARRCSRRWRAPRKIRPSAGAGWRKEKPCSGLIAWRTSRLMFYRDAIDVSLEDGNWDEALRYADDLEEFARPEPFALRAGRRAGARASRARASRT